MTPCLGSRNGFRDPALCVVTPSTEQAIRRNYTNIGGRNYAYPHSVLQCQDDPALLLWLSCRVGGDSSVRKVDLDAGAAEVDDRGEGVG